ncbi:hypothetical protein ThimaDRAFT_4205 [Thiocapsa marina 5811]|uniref:Uncharacterized protein n=1 Tax=Thiocapsa marina 5811 TaxID=768671 RepID=F9UH32_9GAMM|nr:hypothetical protein ThimaDRAFT_4205 [Thiocapsa marina 5811]
MLSLNVHDVQNIDLGCVRSYFCRDNKRLFYAREILIHSVSGSFRLSLFADQTQDLDLDQAELSRFPTELNAIITDEGVSLCHKS